MKVQQKMIVGLQGIIPGGISVDDFCAVTKINPIDSEKILDEFVKNKIGSKQDTSYYFENGDKLKIAVALLEHGFPVDEISIVLDWRDFEGLTAEILTSKGFAVIKNMILTKPRMEIDVIGIRLGIAILIDCKHWKRYSTYSLTNAVKKQIERTKKLRQRYILHVRGTLLGIKWSNYAILC